MNKGIVFFFEGKFNSWYCTQVSFQEDGRVRGYVADGHWWMDYDPMSGTVNVCTPQMGVVNWESPINVMTEMGKPRMVSVVDCFAEDYNSIIEWARRQ